MVCSLKLEEVRSSSESSLLQHFGCKLHELFFSASTTESILLVLRRNAKKVEVVSNGNLFYV